MAAPMRHKQGYVRRGLASAQLFENLPQLLTTDEVAKLLGRSRETVYAWRKKRVKYATPKNLFHKFGSRLYIRQDVLRQWFIERNEIDEP